jgi:hypothetical protein
MEKGAILQFETLKPLGNREVEVTNHDFQGGLQCHVEQAHEMMPTGCCKTQFFD